MDPFEQHLRRQTPREIPASWRDPILSAAQVAPARDLSLRESARLTFRERLNAWLWPHPIAWSALAACWVVILAVNLSLHEPAPVMAKKSAPMAPDTLAELKRERILLAEVEGLSEPPDVDRAKKSPLQPRTECTAQAMV